MADKEPDRFFSFVCLADLSCKKVAYYNVFNIGVRRLAVGVNPCFFSMQELMTDKKPDPSLVDCLEDNKCMLVTRCYSCVLFLFSH